MRRLALQLQQLAMFLLFARWLGDCKLSDEEIYDGFLRLKEMRKLDPTHIPAKSVALRELWSEAALNAIFKNAAEIPIHEIYVTAYGKGIAGPPDAPIIEAITSIPSSWLRYVHARQGDIAILALSKPGDPAPGCSFDASQFETVTIANTFLATRDSVLAFCKGFAYRVGIGEKTTALMETMGFPVRNVVVASLSTPSPQRPYEILQRKAGLGSAKRIFLIQDP